MFDHDHSAARGMMATRRLIVFKHSSALGNARASDLFARVAAATTEETPRSYGDYVVSIINWRALSRRCSSVSVDTETSALIVLSNDGEHVIERHCFGPAQAGRNAHGL